MTDKQWQSKLKEASYFVREYAASEEQQRAMCEIIEKFPKDAVIVELGVCRGMTGALFTLSAKGNYCGVDNFKMLNNYQEVMDGFQQLDAKNWEIFNSDTQSLPWDKPIDFLFIDAGHDEANVKPDCEKWIPYVKLGGYVAFHDWLECMDKDINPHWAVDYYGSLATQGWEDIDYIGNQLKIKRKPNG